MVVFWWFIIELYFQYNYTFAAFKISFSNGRFSMSRSSPAAQAQYFVHFGLVQPRPLAYAQAPCFSDFACFLSIVFPFRRARFRSTFAVLVGIWAANLIRVLAKPGRISQPRPFCHAQAWCFVQFVCFCHLCISHALCSFWCNGKVFNWLYCILCFQDHPGAPECQGSPEPARRIQEVPMAPSGPT